MSVITIDLNKNPEVAALVADKDVGAKIYGCFSIKAKDDQTLSLRVSEMAGSKDELSDKEEGSEDEDTDEVDAPEAAPAETEKPAEESIGKRVAKKMTGYSAME